MIVRCEECSTKFNLDESRLRGDSAKVRCSKCRHEFIVYKSQESPPAEELNADYTTAQTPAETAESSEMTFDSGFDFSSSFDEPTVDAKKDDSFDLFGSDESLPQSQTDFSLPPAEEETSAAEAAKPVELPSDSDIFSFADVAPVDESPKKVREEQIKPMKSSVEPASEPLEFSFGEEEQTSAPAAESIEFGAIEFGIPDSPKEEAVLTPQEEPFKPAETETAKFIPQQFIEEATPSFFNEYKPFIFAGVGTLLLTALLTAGYFGIKGKPGDPARLGIQNITTPGEEEKGSFAVEKPVARFVKNSSGGELFVVNAMAVNNYESPRVGVEAQLTFFSKDGKAIGTSTAFCNSELQDEDLESMPYAEIQKVLNQGPSDDPLENTPVNKGDKAECVLVVNDMPKDAVDYGVEIINSQGEKLDDL